MALSINPLAKLVSSAAGSLQGAIAQASGAVQSLGDAVAKADLDGKINQLAGGIGSGLNGLTGSATNLVAGAQSALGGIGSQIQSTVGGAVGSLQSVAGSISNTAADISGSLNKLGAGDLAGGLSSIAGTISSAAGILNNFLSLGGRARNLPAGGELFAQVGPAIQLQPNAKNDWRVRINAQWSLFNSPLFKLLENTGGVVWPYNPNITVSTKANYTNIDAVHSNYPFQAYKNSQVDEIQISGEFTCETETDAAYWIAATTFFKTATKMFFGKGANAGNPPIVCNLSGYGSSVFDSVPVVVKSFSVDMKEDVNYIKCNTFGTNTWVPVISTISVTVSPIYNRRKLRTFSLQDYAKGKMTSSDGVGYL